MIRFLFAIVIALVLSIPCVSDAGCGGARAGCNAGAQRGRPIRNVLRAVSRPFKAIGSRARGRAC